ncbi:hypothetical protein SDRG_12706 [Saprolegnia diclina VS20]|uniref:Uncharacterized protein n=1 Tax=Saprolegnia diclina (strain VS20) TaxID=1156394 RepID=T0Q514_SAPDV|nr:hypothetical protein SDRG_12706 [Saprolegnia diclina VS20]EQC29706.1 hypothetical protein SDRG_12706 [Saprolegnia diclina VS20]|eukprot:XP_008617010.1 hypothetical protein SDRG_12706 [Saprolegnia diclina VS20]
MDVVEHNLALRELWKRKGEYGLHFVLDEIHTLRQLGLVSDDEYMRLMRQTPATTPTKSLPDELQAALDDRISALLDAQTYFPLDQIQAVLESEFQISLLSHKEWLQHTIFRQSKVKLQKINHAAALARASAGASVLQAAYRRHRVSFLHNARARRTAALEAANNVARRAIDNYALDVIGRFLLRRMWRQRFRKALRIVRSLLRRRYVQRERALQIVRRFCCRVLALRRAEAARRKLSSGLVPMRPRTKKPHTLPAVTRSAVVAPALPPVKLIKRYDRICSTCASPHHTQCRRPSLSSPMKSWIAVPTLYPTKPSRPKQSNQEASAERPQPTKPSTVHLPALRSGVPRPMKRAVSQL